MSFALSTASVPMTQMCCGECGIVFWVPEDWRAMKQSDGSNWHCPNGHVRVYRETEAMKLKKQLEQKERDLKWEQDRAVRQQATIARLERRGNALKGQVTRVKNRVGNGVCPCCNRHFTNLERHIKGEHPEWQGQEVGG